MRPLLLGEKIIGVACLLAVLMLLGIGYGFPPLNLARPPEASHLEIFVKPPGVPASGFWNVSTFLYDSSNDSTDVVAASVTMVAVMGNATAYNVTKETESGRATFAVPTGTAAVTFTAYYDGYSATDRIAGPNLMSPNLATTYLGLTLTASIAALSWAVVRGSRFRPSTKRLVWLIPSFVGVALPIAYTWEAFGTWSGTGWTPSSFDGTPIGWFPVLAALLALPTMIAAEYYSRGAQDDEEPGPDLWG